MMHRKNKTGIPEEKIGLIAEKGIDAARLGRKEKKILLTSGMEEVYAAMEMQNTSVPALDNIEIDRLMGMFFPEKRPAEARMSSLWIKIRDYSAELAGTLDGWSAGSPAFACRGAEAKTVTLHREFGKLTMHLEVIGRPDRLADIHLLLTDESRRDKSTFEVELFRGDRCVEAIDGTKGETTVLSRVETGDYMLKVSDSKGEITSLNLRMD
jgi:hypothetical protein